MFFFGSWIFRRSWSQSWNIHNSKRMSRPWESSIYSFVYKVHVWFTVNMWPSRSESAQTTVSVDVVGWEWDTVNSHMQIVLSMDSCWIAHKQLLVSTKVVSILFTTLDHTGPVPTSTTDFTNFFQELQTHLVSEPATPVPPSTLPSPTTVPDNVYTGVGTLGAVVGVLGAVLLVVGLLLAIITVVIVIKRRRWVTINSAIWNFLDIITLHAC